MKLSFLLLGELAFIAALVIGQSSAAPDRDLSNAKTTRKPNRNPTRKPTRNPTRRPTRKPTRKATPRPTKRGKGGGGVPSNVLDPVILTLRNIADPLKLITPNSNLQYDLDKDGVVTIEDVVLLLTSLLNSGAVTVADLIPGGNMTDFVLTNFEPNNNSTRRLEEITSPTIPTVVDFPFDTRGLQQADDCGVASGEYNGYTKGTAPSAGPPRQFTRDFVRDPSVPVRWYDYLFFAATQQLIDQGVISYVTLTVLLPGVQAVLDAISLYVQLKYIGTQEGREGFRHYLRNSGSDITVDYEKAIREDAGISNAVDAEIRAATDAARALGASGSDTSFQFYKTTTRSVASTTVNWKGALGRHLLWSTGTATYNQAQCQVDVSLEISAEDLYDFNRDDPGIGTAARIASNIFGRFTVYGWSSPFMTKTKVTRTDAIELQCCQDTDCGQADVFDCVCNLCEAQCPTTQVSGGQGFTSFTVDLKKKNGTFPVSYDMYSIPDGLNIFYEGESIFSTGGLVSGSRQRRREVRLLQVCEHFRYRGTQCAQ
ncbi:hypothetical protein MHU86_22781 [Fragilaria crotonensis]|nr:hypothetical protein MHU86_22781 [Fragilaria crotonensis]